jgi:hypothetical protein
MKRITLEEAKQYLPLKENYGNTDVKHADFFTIIPSEKGDGWENITYYTIKKLGLYADQGEGDQWVYILSNPDLPINHLKIGYTKNSPEERAKQISSSTGVARPFRVEWAYKCFNGETIERAVHHYLKPYRISNNKEFFQIKLEEAKEAINFIGQKYT